jgi:hypothetical protein
MVLDDLARGRHNSPRPQYDRAWQDLVQPSMYTYLGVSSKSRKSILLLSQHSVCGVGPTQWCMLLFDLDHGWEIDLYKTHRLIDCKTHAAELDISND